MSEVDYILNNSSNAPRAHSKKSAISKKNLSSLDISKYSSPPSFSNKTKNAFLLSQKSGIFRGSFWSVVLMVVFFAIGLTYYFRSVFFFNEDDFYSLLGIGIEQVTLAGHNSTSDADIFEVLKLEKVPSFLTLNAIEREERLKKLPWVKEASIKRIWPNQVAISIKEREPFGIWQLENKAFLIDEEGRTLGPLKNDVDLHLPRFAGQGASSHASDFWSLIQSYPQIRDKIDYAEFVNNRRWSLKLKEGALIDLPTEGEGSALSLLASHPRLHALLNESSCNLDLRFTDRIILRGNQKVKSDSCSLTALSEIKKK